MAVAIFVTPIIVAFKKQHVYKWVIVGLTLTSPIFLGVTWLVAIVWVLLPQGKTILDPLVESGDGARNVGSVASGIVGNFRSGTGRDPGLESRLAEIERLFQSGLITLEEKEKLRSNAIDK